MTSLEKTLPVEIQLRIEPICFHFGTNICKVDVIFIHVGTSKEMAQFLFVEVDQQLKGNNPQSLLNSPTHSEFSNMKLRTDFFGRIQTCKLTNPPSIGVAEVFLRWFAMITSSQNSCAKCRAFTGVHRFVGCPWPTSQPAVATEAPKPV